MQWHINELRKIIKTQGYDKKMKKLRLRKFEKINE